MAQWNLWHGCSKISEGCKNCYVYRTDAKHQKDSTIVTKTSNFNLPIKKNREKEYKILSGETVYTCFTSDFFVEDADVWRQEAWDIIKERADLNFLFITKRIARFNKCIPKDWGDGYPNVTIGCTCENQKQANIRLPIFAEVPIAKKFIACEPLLEEINLSPYINRGISLVVAGGESGYYARSCNYDWVLNLCNQCKDAGISFWFKQTGAKFIKDGKQYFVQRKDQHTQAKKAGISFYTKDDLVRSE